MLVVALSTSFFIVDEVAKAASSFRRLLHCPLETNSCLRVVSDLLAEFDDEWMTGKVYLNLNP
jgi:hypothetical protein